MMADTKKLEFKGTPGKLALAEDYRTDGKNNRYIILADNSKMVASIVRKNASRFKDKTDDLGLLHPDPEAEANAHLLLASKDMLEVLEELVDVSFPEDLDGWDAIKKARKVISKAYGHGTN